jgi:oligoribonuclease
MTDLFTKHPTQSVNRKSNNVQPRILEVAILLSDPDLQDLGVYHSVCHLDAEDLATRLAPWSLRTHAHNGLLQEVRDSQKSIQDIDQELEDFLRGATDGKLADYLFIPSGISINNDLKFAEKELPRFYQWLHYQTIELSGLRRLVSLWSPRYRYAPRRFSPRHRALPDVYSAFNLLLYYKSTLFREPTYYSTPQAQTGSNKILDPYLQQKHIDGLMEDKLHASSSWAPAPPLANTTTTTMDLYTSSEATTYYVVDQPAYFIDPSYAAAAQTYNPYWFTEANSTAA